MPDAHHLVDTARLGEIDTVEANVVVEQLLAQDDVNV
jgi:hypothetical protein